MEEPKNLTGVEEVFRVLADLYFFKPGPEQLMIKLPLFTP